MFYRNSKSSKSTSQLQTPQLQRYGSVDLGSSNDSSGALRESPVHSPDLAPRTKFARNRTSSCYVGPSSFYAQTRTATASHPQFQLELESHPSSPSPVFKIPTFETSSSSQETTVIEPVMSNDTIVSVTTITEEDVKSSHHKSSSSTSFETTNSKGHSRQTTPVTATHVEVTTPGSSLSARSASSMFSRENTGDKTPTTPISEECCDFVHKFQGALWISERPRSGTRPLQNELHNDDDPFDDDQCEDLALNSHRHVRSLIFS